MQLYTVTLRKNARRSMTNLDNRAMWIGFEPNIESANKKAEAMYPGFTPVWFSEMSLLECVYLLPFLQGRQADRQSK